MTVMEERLKNLKPIEISATRNRGWWEVEIIVLDTSYTGKKDRTIIGALLNAIDSAETERTKG